MGIYFQYTMVDVAYFKSIRLELFKMKFPLCEDSGLKQNTRHK